MKDEDQGEGEASRCRNLKLLNTVQSAIVGTCNLPIDIFNLEYHAPPWRQKRRRSYPSS